MRKIYLKDIGIILLSLGLIFQNWLIENFRFITVLDEALALIGIVMYIYAKIKTKRMLKKDLLLLSIMIVLVIFSIISNVLFEIQSSKIAILYDIVGIFKFLFLYLGLKEYSLYKEKKFDLKFILIILSNIMKIYVFILFAFSLINIFKDIGMHPEMRYGLRSFAFIYGTPGHIINQMTYVLLIFASCNDRLNRKNKVWIFMTIFIILSTLKTRAFVLVALYIYLNYIFIYRKKQSLGKEILAIGIIALLVGFSQFEYYFLESNTPRQAFLLGSFRFAKEYFPFGTGFATFGSSAAADYYSPLYYKLGFNLRYGMDPKSPLFLNDNYIPMILAEFGVLGILLFIYLIINYCIDIKKSIIDTSSQVGKCTGYFFLINALFSSIQSSYLAHYSMVALSFFMFFFFSKGR